MKTTPCRYCHQPTNRVYSDNRVKGSNKLLVSSCKQCASGIPYLRISLIFKEPSNPFKYVPIPDMQEIVKSKLKSANQIEEII